VNLPKLSIKPFGGDITQWFSFWESYDAAIHSNPDLSTVNYLRSYLEPPVHDVVAGLSLTAANYQHAIEVLKKRFGNKQQVISKQIDLLLNIEAVTSQDHLKGLRHLVDTVEIDVRGLKALDVTSESYSCLLTSVLLSKLPQELRLLLSKKVGEGSWTTDTLMMELQSELEARDHATVTFVTPGQPVKRHPKEPHTAAALMSTAPGLVCCYC